MKITPLFAGMVRLTLACWCLLAALPGSAQVSQYTFTRSTQAYQAVDVDTILGSRYTDETIFNIPTKFPLRFADTVVDRIRISPNGVIAMGTGGVVSTSSGVGFVNFSNPNGIVMRSRQGINRNLVVPFNTNMQAKAGAELGASWDLAAPLGQRSLTVQWTGYRRNGTRFTRDSIHFQVVLRENGTIEMRYGNFILQPGLAPGSAQVGLRGSGPSDLLTLRGTWAAPNPGTGARDTLVITPTSLPPAGTVFTFEPFAPGIQNLAVLKAFAATSNNSILNCNPQAPQTIGVVVYNFGTQALAGGQISYRIGSAAALSQNATFSPALQPFTLDTIYFTGSQAFTPTNAGAYSLTAYGSIPTDPSRRNDTTRTTLVVRGPVPINLSNAVTDLTTARRQGWRQGQGLSGLNRDSINFFRSSFPPGFTSSIGAYVPVTPVSQPQWFYLPSRQVGGLVSMRFKLGVTKNFAGNTPWEVYDDTLKVVVSRDCGATWQTVARFDQRDLTSGRLNNTPQEFTAQLTSGAGIITVAFYYTSNGTDAANAYRWHIDDIRFIAARDAAANTVRLRTGRFPGCALSTQEPVTLEFTNNGTAPITQLDAGYSLNGGPTVRGTFTLQAVQPGQTGTVTFTGTSGANLFVTGVYSFKGFTVLAQDGSVANDTVVTQVSTLASLPIPGPARVADLPAARAAGWKLASGNPITRDTSTLVRPAFLTGNNAIGIFVDATPTAGTAYEWFYRPGTRTTGQVGISFKLAVSEGWALPLTRPTSIGDDTLKLIVSSDCGTTWSTVAAFNQSALAANQVDETLRTFNYTLINTAGSLQVAFVYTANGTARATQYRWLLDDLFFISANDLQAAAVDVPALRFTGCELSAQNLVNVQIRNAGSQPATAATVSYRIAGRAPVSRTVSFSPALAPGLSQNFSFNGAEGADLIGLSGLVRVQAIVTLSTADGNRSNDTLTRSFLAGAGVAQPLADDTVETLLDARRSGWRMAQGEPIARDTNYIVRSQNIPDLGGDVITFSVADTILRQTFLFYKTAIQAQGPLSVRFQAGLIRVQTNAPRVQSIGTDTMELVISRDCGQSWQAIYRFTQRDVQTGRVDSTMQTFGGLLVSEPGAFTVAFRLKVGNTVAAPYRWIFDNVILSSRKDVALARIASPVAPLSQYCFGSTLPVGVVVRNAGIQRIDSVTVIYRLNQGPPVSEAFSIELPSGAERLVTLSPSLAITPPQGAFTLSVQIITSNESTDDTTNNRASITLQGQVAGTLPQGPFRLQQDFTAAGWSQQQQSVDGILAGTDIWLTGRAYLARSLAATPAISDDRPNRKLLVSPSFVPARGIGLSFSSAISISPTSSSRAALGDDTLYVAYRSNCGPWLSALSFTQADITANRIGNQMRSFIQAIPFMAGDTMQIAFILSNASTDNDSPYYWHVTDVTLGDVVANRSLSQGRLLLSPNPAQGRVRLSTLVATGPAILRLLDLQGRVLRTQAFSGTEVDLTLTGLAIGLYTVELHSAKATLRERLVIE